MVSSCMKDGKMAFYTFFVFEEFAQKANKKCITIGPRFCTFANRNIQFNCEKNHLKAFFYIEYFPCPHTHTHQK